MCGNLHYALVDWLVGNIASRLCVGCAQHYYRVATLLAYHYYDRTCVYNVMYVCMSMSVHHRFLVEIILNHSSVSTLQMQYLFLSVRYLNQLSCMHDYGHKEPCIMDTYL